MPRNKNIILICVILLISASTCLRGKSSQQPEQVRPKINIENCNLILGWGSWPPYQWGNNGNSPRGLQISLVKQIAKQANCKLSFVKQSFSENIEAVKNGTVDFIMDTSITDYRKEFGLFTIPYRFEAMVLYVKPQFIQYCKKGNINDVLGSGIKIGVNRGNIYGEEVSKVQNDAKFRNNFIDSATNDGLFELFKSGEIDGFFEDPTVM
ncbi:MAG: transporter substrate-binding domain-containing protein, partial [Kangiellaceae bacterium]|nr:transporter substrate-binding domain-containing protein [Kangiellaceae bacterium]